MLKNLFIPFIFVFIMCAPLVVAAAPKSATEKKLSCKKPTPEEATELIKKTGLTVVSVKGSPIKGLLEMQVEENGQKGVFYMDCTRKYLVWGQALDRETLKPVTTHEMDFGQPQQPVSIDIKQIPAKGLIVMGNPAGSKKLYVFTDPDCPYCRKAHAELKKLAEIAPDVAINIVLYPLPMHPGAYDKARVIVETQSMDILDKAFEGGDVPKPSQESSKKIIDENIAFSVANGISATPAVVMPDGRIELGVKDAEALKKELEEK